MGGRTDADGRSKRSHAACSKMVGPANKSGICLQTIYLPAGRAAENTGESNALIYFDVTHILFGDWHTIFVDNLDSDYSSFVEIRLSTK